MGYFPFFVELEGKEGLIVGGGRIAAHKIEKIKPFGAKLTVVAPYLSEDIKEDPEINCKERPFWMWMWWQVFCDRGRRMTRNSTRISAHCAREKIFLSMWWMTRKSAVLSFRHWSKKENSVREFPQKAQAR